MSNNKMTKEELQYARSLGEQVGKNKPLSCPNCSKEWKDSEGQPLCCYGDFPEVLFCPHCETDIKLVVKISE